MNYYGAKDLAASFRTVRNNTLAIAEEIPEDQYSYRPAEGSRTVGEMLTHIALGGKFQEQVNLVEKRSSMEGFDFMKFMGTVKEQAGKPRSKAEIITLLKDEGEKYAKALDSLSDEFLAQSVATPPGGTPASRTRFEMLDREGARDAPPRPTYVDRAHAGYHATPDSAKSGPHGRDGGRRSAEGIALLQELAARLSFVLEAGRPSVLGRLTPHAITQQIIVVGIEYFVLTLGA